MSSDSTATHTHLIIETLNANESLILLCVLMYSDGRQLP